MKPIYLALFAVTASANLYCQHTHTLALPLQKPYQHKVTFAVDAVKPAADTLPARAYGDVLHECFVMAVLESERYAHEGQPGYVAPNRRLECYSRDRRPITGAQTNGFFETVHYAYGRHHALVISPDMIWLAIAQGFARHVNENGEAMRHYFVQHQGKKVLDVPMTGMIRLGDDSSDWEWAFQQFHDSIAANTSPELAELVAGRFSGTNSDAAVAFDITLMDAMKTYFDYWGGISCGIPNITLEGSPEDWLQVEQRAARLRQYDLDWWINDLQPILSEFTKTAQGHPDRNFWKGIVKDIHEPICGGDTYITGWIIRFFPYVKKGEVYVRNPVLGLKTEDLYQYVSRKTVKKAVLLDGKQVGEMETTPPEYYSMCEGDDHRWVEYMGPKVTTDAIPSGISTAILNIDDNGVLHKMELKAGFFGYRQELETMALRPAIGWVVIDTGEEPDKDDQKRYDEHLKKH